jgi:hypothetical protein
MFCNILYAPKDTANPPAYGANDGVIVLKRRILAIILVSMVFMGVVSASSINGDYKGNPIVKVKSDGKLLESDEVPAMIYDGHTLVPISLLRQLGAYVNWDANAYSVDIRLPQSPTVTPTVNTKSTNFRDVLKSTNGNIYFHTFGDTLAVTSNFEMKTSFSQDWPEIAKVINKLTEQDADNYNVNYMSNGRSLGMVGIDRKSVEDFASGKISSNELDKRWVLTGFQTSATPQPIVQPTPTTNNSNVQTGESGNFQFIGVSDFYDSVGLLHVAGQIKNIAVTNSFGGVQITITLFDQNGNVVGSQSGYAAGGSTFKIGETASFDIMFFNAPKNYTRYEVKAKS